MCRRWRAGREGTPMLKVVHDEAEPNEASGSVLDEIAGEAARQMLAVALQAEVSAYIDAHAEEVDENGHPSPSLPAAVARAVSGIRVSAAADKGHDRHLTR